MDKLHEIYVLARKLDRFGDEELNARTPAEKRAARAKMIEAEREYAAALDALHEARSPGNDDDAQAPASLERTG